MESFDLRLTVLRLFRSLKIILLITLAGTLLAGGIYYAQNVLLVEQKYSATVTCKVAYLDPPTKSGDYFINAMTWNTYVDSQEFLGLVQASEKLTAADPFFADEDLLREAFSANIASDIFVPSFTVTDGSKERVAMLVQAVADVLSGPWTDRLAEVASIDVIDISEAQPVVDEFVRPGRAFVLGAVLSLFFAVVLFLLRETGADSIWLPATLRTRYGLAALGTIESAELAENIRYAFGEKQGKMDKISLCAAQEGIDPKEVLSALRERGVLDPSKEWVPMPAPLLSPETAQKLRETDGVMLAVPAGLHAGKKLEHTLEFLTEQDVRVTAALLWDADEILIRSYYLLPGGRE